MAYRRKKSSFKLYKLMPVLVVIIALFFVLIVGVIGAKGKNDEYASKIVKLRYELEQEQKRTTEIEEYNEYVKTDEYKKEVLREKFNYADKNEIVFKFTN